MFMRFRILFLLLFFPLFSPLSADVGLITVPKSGTHLIMKFMDLLAEQVDLPSPVTGGNPNCWCAFHHTIQIPSFIYNRERLIFGVRDPRDVLISTVHWFDYLVDCDAPNFTKSFKQHWIQLGFRQKNKLLVHNKKDFAMVEFQSIMNWVKANPHALVLHFEDLIGKSGGGDSQSQKETFLTILDYLGINSNFVDLSAIEQKLFGNSSSFRKGKIGSWRDYSHPEDFEDPLIDEFLTFFGYAK